MKNRVSGIISRMKRARIVLKQGSERRAHWPELNQFLSSYGGNPGNEGSYLLFHRVLWRIKKGGCDKDASDEKKNPA